MYILSTFYLIKKMGVAEGVSKYLPTKRAMKLRKFPHLCCLLKGGKGKGGGCNFYKKKLKSEMLKSLTTKKVDNFFLCHY